MKSVELLRSLNSYEQMYVRADSYIPCEGIIKIVQDFNEWLILRNRILLLILVCTDAEIPVLVWEYWSFTVVL